MVNDLDYERLATLNIAVIDTLSNDIESSVMQSDIKSLTDSLRATGLALGNISKLRAMQKRERPEEEDDGISELIMKAKEKASKIYDKAKEAKTTP